MGVSFSLARSCPTGDFSVQARSTIVDVYNPMARSRWLGILSTIGALLDVGDSQRLTRSRILDDFSHAARSSSLVSLVGGTRSCCTGVSWSGTRFWSWGYFCFLARFYFMGDSGHPDALVGAGGLVHHGALFQRGLLNTCG